MSKKNKTSKKKKRDKKDSSQKKSYKGVVDVTRSGMAFVAVEGLDKDIRVKPENLNTALDGDEVTVDIIKQGKQLGRMDGVITKVDKRRQTEFSGTIQLNKNFAFLVTSEESVPDIYIAEKDTMGAKDGDKAVVRIMSWGEKTKKPVGKVTTVLDREDVNDTAMKEILVESGFPLAFPDEVLQESEAIPDAIPEEEIKNRKDIRKVFTVTIDPVDAKDFDDAISLRKLKNGNWEVGVHIADVSYFVTPGTKLDEEAERRATSVYLADRVLPMLPERISNGLCSLRPHEDKLTFSAIFQITPDAKIKHYWIGRTVIHSNHRFTYEDVQEIIETGEGSFSKEILTLNELARQFRKKRFEQGAINFSSVEVRFQLDENAFPVGILIKESKEAHQLIEEMMLLANKQVAEYAAKIKVNGQPIPFPYRVHDVPDEAKLKVFTTFASKFGYKFDTSSPEAIAQSFNHMLKAADGRPEKHVLETLGIRTMSKAVYSTENIGHYGLGFEDYCHFTSPIRRYPDVMVHRIIAHQLENNLKVDKQLEKRCRHSSEMERKAMDAERAANKYKQVEYMRQFIGEEFDGVISGVAPFGFWVEVVENKCEGMVSIHSLPNKEDFFYSESEYALIGERSQKRYRIGETVRIQVVAANLEKRQLDYELVEEAPKQQKQEVKKVATKKAATKKAPTKKAGTKNVAANKSSAKKRSRRSKK